MAVRFSWKGIEGGLLLWVFSFQFQTFQPQMLNIRFLSSCFIQGQFSWFPPSTFPPFPNPAPLPCPVWHAPRHWMDPKCFLLSLCQGRSNWAEKKKCTSLTTATRVGTTTGMKNSWYHYIAPAPGPLSVPFQLHASGIWEPSWLSSYPTLDVATTFTIWDESAYLRALPVCLLLTCFFDLTTSLSPKGCSILLPFIGTAVFFGCFVNKNWVFRGAARQGGNGKEIWQIDFPTFILCTEDKSAWCELIHQAGSSSDGNLGSFQ